MQQNTDTEPLWNMTYDGSCGKTGSGVGIWLYNQKTNQAEGYTYKINFMCTKNIAKYQALLLILKLLKNICAKSISIKADSKLIIIQIKGNYSAEHPRLREYRNVVIDFLQTFEEYDLAVIPRLQNALASGLAFSASTFELAHPNKQYTIEVKHHHEMHDNMRCLKLFGNDKQIESFL